jgi:hypothetical protein
MMGPLGPLLPYPGVSYLFSNAPGTAHHDSDPNLPSHLNLSGFPDSEMSGSLWGIANGGMSASGSFMVGGTLSSPPATGWTSSLGDMVMRIDTKLKVRTAIPVLHCYAENLIIPCIHIQKITTVLLKDLDTFARNGIRDELASLDPLLRNVSNEDGPAGGGLMYDFEGN